MFKNRDYTLAEVAVLFDCLEDGLAKILQAFSYRRYWLFGPVVYEKVAIDDMAPRARAIAQELGTTRAEMQARQQEVLRLQRANEEQEARLAAMREQHLQAFWEQAEAIYQKVSRDIYSGKWDQTDL